MTYVEADKLMARLIEIAVMDARSRAEWTRLLEDRMPGAVLDDGLVIGEGLVIPDMRPVL